MCPGSHILRPTVTHGRCAERQCRNKAADLRVEIPKGIKMEREIHRSPEEARAGSTPHIVRYVLMVSLLLALIVMTLLLLWGNTQS